ncbi:MAG: SIMPL domain-containing protein [Clostridiales bacterium]|nr:SIMPL domain-containing protein [Clostridiales bacterium]
MEQRLISVTETASEKFPVDYVIINVTASAEKDYCSDAHGEVIYIASEVAKAIEKVGGKVRVTSISESPIRDGKKIIGYRAVQLFTVGIDYNKEKVEKCLAAVTSWKCEYRVSYTFKNKSASKKVTASAVTAARARAETIAFAAGVKLGKLVKVDYGMDGGGIMPMRASLDAAGRSEPEDITVSETVTCAFEICD